MSVPVKAVGHTTASTPRPHILYAFQIERDGTVDVVKKRYSEFVHLHAALGASDLELPPKRILVTTFVPSAWVDDALISERKKGLKAYLNALLADPAYKDQAALKEFLSPALRASPRRFDLEDALPSTLSRKTAQELAPVVAATTFIAAAYYPDWAVDDFPPESLDYSKFDILDFAFATPNSSSTLTWDSGSQDILKRLVSSARASGAGTKIVLSVGGWGGSAFFHAACGSAANRATVRIDIDWEYPNDPGAGNAFGSADAANLLLVITSLRTAIGNESLKPIRVFPDGNPIKDMSAYAAQMTYANLMNYDIFGGTLRFLPSLFLANLLFALIGLPGPNAPLGNLCGTSSQPQYSAEAAFSQWTAAKFPANKLLLGLPLYGYVLDSTKTVLTGSFVDPALEGTSTQAPASPVAANPIRGGNKRPPTHPSGTSKIGVVAAANANLQSWWGQQIPFSSLVSSGALVKNADGSYSGAGGFTEGWDDCSDTPYLFNTAQKTVVSYDGYAKSKGMAGCFTWSLDQDDGVTLQNVIRKSLGK
ncbi:glycoside hydrolase family 18 protein [Mycena amicta]|nr:glycoside hydrolase family 18 protein [Mycena amicta]